MCAWWGDLKNNLIQTLLEFQQRKMTEREMLVVVGRRYTLFAHKPLIKHIILIGRCYLDTYAANKWTLWWHNKVCMDISCKKKGREVQTMMMTTTMYEIFPFFSAFLWILFTLLFVRKNIIVLEEGCEMLKEKQEKRGVGANFFKVFSYRNVKNQVFLFKTSKIKFLVTETSKIKFFSSKTSKN